MNNLNLKERKKIEHLLKIDKAGVNEISRILKRSSSTISVEIKRNTLHGSYNAEEAHRRALIRIGKRGNNIDKIDRYPKLKEFIINRLRQEDSPDEIAGRINKLQLKSELGGNISVETIYKFIYDKKNKHLKLWQHLRRHKLKRYH